jgi:hypothetical protein
MDYEEYHLLGCNSMYSMGLYTFVDRQLPNHVQHEAFSPGRSGIKLLSFDRMFYLLSLFLVYSSPIVSCTFLQIIVVIW